MQDIVDLVNEYNRINESFANPLSDDEMQKVIARQGEVQEKIDQGDFRNLVLKLEKTGQREIDLSEMEKVLKPE